MDWTKEQVDQLKALWGDKTPISEIGRLMGISRNAVVGKAHRLHLEPRPSPIIRNKRRRKAAAA